MSVPTPNESIGALALTKFDTLSGVHPIRVCVAYRCGGRRLKEFPASRRDQARAMPVYRELPGFSGDLGGARRFSDLPPAARRYARWIESQLRCPIALVSVGQSREQTVTRSAAAAWPAKRA